MSRLTPTSYVILGLVERMTSATPYQLKQAVAAGLGEFWSLPHTQLYSECRRLDEAGLLDERHEETGRRRRIYRITAAGRRALVAWRSEPTAELYEIRDAGLLKLFFGADAPEGARLTVAAGIGHEREYVRFWTRVRDGRA